VVLFLNDEKPKLLIVGPLFFFWCPACKNAQPVKFSFFCECGTLRRTFYHTFDRREVPLIVPHSQKNENFYRLGIFTGWAPEKKEGAND